jgi:hypothetical protein
MQPAIPACPARDVQNAQIRTVCLHDRLKPTATHIDGTKDGVPNTRDPKVIGGV